MICSIVSIVCIVCIRNSNVGGVSSIRRRRDYGGDCLAGCMRETPQIIITIFEKAPIRGI